MSKKIKNIFTCICLFVWIFLSAQVGFAQNKSGSTKPPSQVTIWYQSFRDYIKSKISGEQKKAPTLPTKVSADVSIASKDNTVASKNISKFSEDTSVASADVSKSSEDTSVASVDATIASTDSTVASTDKTAAAQAEISFAEYYKIKKITADIKDVNSKAGFDFRLQQQKEALSILNFEKLIAPTKIEIDRKKFILNEIKKIRDEVGLKAKEPLTAQLMDPKSPKFNPKYYYLKKAISYYSKRTIFGALEFNNRVLESKVFMQDMKSFEKEFHSLFRKDFRKELPAFDTEAKEYLGRTLIRGLQITKSGSLKERMLQTYVKPSDRKSFALWADRVDKFYPMYLTQLLADHSYKEIDWLYKSMQKTTQSNQLISYTAVIGLVWIYGQMNLDEKKLSYAQIAVKKILCSRTELPAVPNLSISPFNTTCP